MLPAPYLEGGVLLHVPQQLGLLGRRVVTHRALELLPWEEGRAGERRQAPPPACAGSARPEPRALEDARQRECRVSGEPAGRGADTRRPGCHR